MPAAQGVHTPVLLCPGLQGHVLIAHVSVVAAPKLVRDLGMEGQFHTSLFRLVYDVHCPAL